VISSCCTLERSVVPAFGHSLDQGSADAPVEPAQGHRRYLRQPAPGRDEFRAVGRNDKHRQARRALDRAVEQIARTGVDPVQVFADEQHRLSPRQPYEVPDQGLEGPFLLTPQAQCKRRIALLRRQRQQVHEEGRIFDRRRCRREQRCELVEPRLDRILAREPGGAFELGDERVEGALLVMRRTEIAQPRMRLADEPVVQDGHQTRLADACIAAQQDYPALAGNRSLPAAQQQLDFPPRARGTASRPRRVTPRSG